MFISDDLINAMCQDSEPVRNEEKNTTEIATFRGHGFDGSPITVIIEQEEGPSEPMQDEMLTEHVQEQTFTGHDQAHMQSFSHNSIAAELQQAITEQVPQEIASEYMPMDVTITHDSQEVASAHVQQEVAIAHAPEHVPKKKPAPKKKKKIFRNLESLTGLLQEAITENVPVELSGPHKESPSRSMRGISIEHRMTDMRSHVKQAEQRMKASSESSDLETLTRLLGEPEPIRKNQLESQEEKEKEQESGDVFEQYLLSV